MDTRNTVETHVRAFERDTLAAFAPLNEMVNQSRAYFERSMTAMREETLELLNRLHVRNGEVLAAATRSGDLAALSAAQEKWFTELGRDVYETGVRVHVAHRNLFADGLENVGQSLRKTNGHSETAEAALDTADEAREELHQHAAE